MASPNPVLGLGSSLMSVQELAKEPMLTIPQHYICADQEPSTLSHGTSLPMIPILDMEQLLMGEATDLELDKLHSICKEWGIFQLVNHGVSSLLVEKLKSEVEEFYKLPVEQKMKYKIKQGDVQGYGQTILVHEAQKVDWADRFYVITNPLYRRKPHLLPQLPCSLRETLESYISELQKLAMTLFGFMARALKIGKSEMEEMFGDGMQSMRMTYYPPCPQPQKVLGLTAHSDAAGLTILLQLNGVEGLQVKRDGNWIPVSILPNAFVVNVGDILEIFSNGLYKSIEHRATVNSVKERISIAMFFSPKFESEVGPSITLINPKNPPLFERVGMEKYFKDFVSRKLNGKSYLEQMRKNNGNENGEGHNTL